MRAAAAILLSSLALTVGATARSVAQSQRVPASSNTTRTTRFTDTLASLSAGGHTTCLTTTAGNAFCWGALGRRDGTPEQILGADGRPARLRAIATSDFSRCGLTLDRDVWCDRSLTDGLVGSDGKPDPVPAACAYYRCLLPLPARGSLPERLSGIAAGQFHACALAPNGTLHCWGVNHMGELGNGTLAPDSTGSVGPVTRAPTPVIGGIRFSQVSAGEELTCALSTPAQAVYCWGYGQNGETGDSSIMTGCDGPKPYYTRTCSTSTPTRVLPESLPGDYTRPNDVKFVRVAAGVRMACAITPGGEAYCWGSNYRCELGRCRSAESARAYRIAVPGRVVEIAAGYRHACARTAERRIFCWGDNTAGQLGSLATVNAGPDGAPPDYRDSTNSEVNTSRYNDPCFNGGRCSPAPVEVSPGRRWAALALGTDHACALADDGGIYCWGGNERQSLGRDMRLMTCENRSPEWKDTRCQPTPVRIPGLPALAPPPPRPTDEQVAARRGRERDEALRSTRVFVSTQEVRVVFPPDTSRTWGWNPREGRGHTFQYYWALHLDGIDGPRTLQLRVGDGGSTSRTFANLDTLVASDEPGLCTGGMMMQCDSLGVTAAVDGTRVVLALREPRVITRLFGLRPDSVSVTRNGPEDAWRPPVRVKVRYVSPQIPAPDSAFLAEAARAQRRYQASIHWIRRSISGGASGSGAVWVGVGDSIPVRLSELRCTHDVCSGSSSSPSPGDVWSVDDSSLVHLRRPPPPTAGEFSSIAPAMYLVAVARGRTTIRVRLGESPADTMPFREPPARTLERAVVVTNPASRVEISARPDTIKLGEPLALRVRVLDRDGQPIDGAPVEVRYEDGGSAYVTTATGELRLELGNAGPHSIVVSFGKLSDTVRVTVTR